MAVHAQQPQQASTGSSRRSKRLALFVSAVLLLGMGATTIAVPSQQNVMAPTTSTTSDKAAVPHRRRSTAHTPAASVREDADDELNDRPLPPSALNNPSHQQRRQKADDDDDSPEAVGIPIRVSREDPDTNDEYHRHLIRAVPLDHSKIRAQLQRLEQRQVYRVEQPLRRRAPAEKASSSAVPPRRVRGSTSSSAAGHDSDDDTDNDVVAPALMVPLSHSQRRAAAAPRYQPPRRTPPPIVDPHPDLPCYERINDQERVFWRCGVAPRSKVHKLEDDDPDTLHFRRCIDPTIAKPERIALSTIQDAIVAVYGDNDVVSKSAYGEGRWESLNLRIMRDALSQRREWRAHRLQELGFSTDQAEAAAQSDVFLLDIGTNVGAFSLPIAHAGFRVLGFEAMPTNQALLHISQCIGNVSQHQLSVQRMGLSDRDADCQLWVNRGNQGNGKLRCHGPKLKTGGHVIVRGDVPLRRLDDQMALRDTRSVVADDPRLRELTGPDAILRSTEYVMKIDVEFHEPEVFRGAVKFFDDKHLRPSIVLFELTWGLNETLDAVQMLVSHGYAMLNRWDLQWVTNEMEVDELFTRARARFRKYDQHDAVFMLPAGRGSSAADLKATMTFERLHADLLAAILRGRSRQDARGL